MSGSPHHSTPGRLQYTPSSDRDKSTAVASSMLGKRRQACEHCRNSKAKCIFDNDNDAICKNCAKSKRECVIEQDRRYPTHPREGNEKRKRRDRNHSANDWKSTPESREQHERSNLDPNKDQKPYGAIFPFLFSGDNPLPNSNTNNTTVSDVIDHGMLSATIAEKFFNFFLNYQVPRLPWIGFATPPSFLQCRFQTPFLFLAIITAGAGCDSSPIQSQLVDEFYKIMARDVIYRSQKSLDIVHAILICTLWTPPPERLEDLRYSTNIHLAASLALDVTQAKLFDMTGHTGPGSKLLEEGERGRDDRSGKADGWRILLACFASCSMMALTLKRPSVMRYNANIEKALATLIDSEISLSDMALRDKTTIKWLQLHRIAESLASARDSILNDSTIVVTKRLLGASFEARLIEWRKSLNQSDEKSETLMVEYYFIHLQTALLAMPENKQETGYPYIPHQLAVSPADIIVVSKSVIAAKSILDRFFAVDAKDIPSVPSILFPRIVFAIMTLVKAARAIKDLNDSSATQLEGTKGNYEEAVELLNISVKYGLGDIKSMQVVEYCDKGIELLNRAAGPRPGRSEKISKLLMLLKGWYFKNVVGQVKPITRQNSKGGLEAAARSQADIDTTTASDRKATLSLHQTSLGPTTSNSFASVASTMDMSPSNTSYQGNSATTKSENISRSYNLPPLSQSRLLPSLSSLQQAPVQVRSELPMITAVIDSHTSYADGSIYSVDPNNPVNSFPTFDPGMYAMGMDGIPPLDSTEEIQYGFLDALLAPTNGGIPFGMMNDSMTGFGWM